MTNFDKIKSLKEEELADLLQDKEYCSKCTYNEGLDDEGNWICGVAYFHRDDCVTGCVSWLKSELI